MNTIHDIIHIVSRNGRPFQDREEAGKALAQVLKPQGYSDPLVLGIPRGGVLVARALARALGCDYDIVLSRKIPSPWSPEYAVGAVGENGHVVVTERDYMQGDALDEYLRRETAHQKAEIVSAEKRYRSVHPGLPRSGKTIIVTDDGLATGATMQAALMSLKTERPSRLVAAVPVAPEDALRSLEGLADEIWCLESPDVFAAVGQCYVRFEQVDDELLYAMLKEGRPGEER